MYLIFAQYPDVNSQSPIVKEYDLSSVYFLFSAAAPLGTEIIEQIVPVLPNAVIGQGYGPPPFHILLDPLLNLCVTQV